MIGSSNYSAPRLVGAGFMREAQASSNEESTLLPKL